MVFRSERLVEIVKIMKKYRIIPKRLRNVYAKKNRNAKISLVEGIKGAGDGLEIEPPVYIYDENGDKSIYIKRLYGSSK